MSLWIALTAESCGPSGGAGGAKEKLRLRELLLPIRRIHGFKRCRCSSRGERGLNNLGAAASGRMEAKLTLRVA